MALNYGGSPYFNTQSAPMFPQPNGNVYLIQNSLEVANIPTSGGLATVICMPENLMYIKTIQNGQPTLLAYTIAPYEAPKTVPTSTQYNLESRVAALEQQLNAIRQGGGKANVQQSSASNAAVYKGQNFGSTPIFLCIPLFDEGVLHCITYVCNTEVPHKTFTGNTRAGARTSAIA